jgi:hypothetical protein
MVGNALRRVPTRFSWSALRNAMEFELGSAERVSRANVVARSDGARKRVKGNQLVCCELDAVAVTRGRTQFSSSPGRASAVPADAARGRKRLR